MLTFLKKVDFRNDLEGMLNFYGQVRATFGYLTPVTRDLVNIGLIEDQQSYSIDTSSPKAHPFSQ